MSMAFALTMLTFSQRSDHHVFFRNADMRLRQPDLALWGSRLRRRPDSEELLTYAAPIASLCRQRKLIGRRVNPRRTTERSGSWIQ